MRQAGRQEGRQAGRQAGRQEGGDTDGRQMTRQPAGSHPDAGLHQHLEEWQWTPSRSGGLSEEEKCHRPASRYNSLKIWRSIWKSGNGLHQDLEECHWTLQDLEVSEEEYNWTPSRSDSIKIWRSWTGDLEVYLMRRISGPFLLTRKVTGRLWEL